MSPTPLRRAVFTDRDGTLIEERPFLADPAGVQLIPGSAGGLRKLRDAGLALVVVTNQSGIGRGILSLDDYERVQEEVERQLAEAGIVLDGTYFCPDPPDHPAESTCRKPAEVMYRAAAEELGVALRRSYYVGDRRTDVAPAGPLEGLGVLVRTGYGRAEEGKVTPGCQVVDDFASAASLICAVERAEAPVDPPFPPG